MLSTVHNTQYVLNGQTQERERYRSASSPNRILLFTPFKLSFLEGLYIQKKRACLHRLGTLRNERGLFFLYFKSNFFFFVSRYVCFFLFQVFFPPHSCVKNKGSGFLR